MTERDLTLAYRIFTGFVVASVLAAFGLLIWRLDSEEAAVSGAAIAMVPAGRGSEIGPLLALSPFGAAQVATPVEGGVKLKAIFMAIPAEASTVLIEGPDGKVAPYGIGASVGGGLIEQIQAEQVLLRTSAGLRSLVFAVEAGTMMPLVASPVQGAQPAAPPASEAATADPAKPAPAPPAGLRISASPLPQLAAGGLKSGDIVQTVNGMALRNGAAESDILARGSEVGVANIEVIRDGRRVSLTVPIR